MKYINLVVLLLLSFVSLQAKLIVKGKLNILYKGYIIYNEPLNGYGNMFYHEKQVAVKSDSTFTIETSIKKEGYLLVKLPGKTLWLFVHPNDALSFNAIFEANKEQKKYLFSDIEFTGNNAAGHKWLALHPYYSIMQQHLINHFFAKKYSGLQAIRENVITDLEQILYPVDSLYKNNAIDALWYEAIMADLKSNYAKQVIDLFAGMQKYKGKTPSNVAFMKPIFDDAALNENLYTQANADSIKLFLYKTIAPFNNKIPYSTYSFLYTAQYSKDLLSGLVKDTISYDSTFAHLKDLEYMGYLKGPFLETNWALYLYWMASTEPDGKEIEKNFSLYTNFFPQSAFLPFLKERLADAIKDRSLSNSGNEEILFINNTSYKSLQELFREKFPNEYVFVDLWATWCSPCIREFTYRNELHALLQSKNIKMLYISVNNLTDKDRWKTFVTTKKLQGFHMLASDALKKQIQQQLYGNGEMTIPRYLLIDKSGNIIGDDMPLPSDMDGLKRAIEKLIAAH